MGGKHPSSAPHADKVMSIGDEGQMLLDLEERARIEGINTEADRYFDFEHLKATGEIVYTRDAEQEWNNRK